MSIELFRLRKPRSDSALKSLSQEIQDEIVQHAQGRSLREVQAWLQEKHHVKRALSTISEFLSWSQIIERRYGNPGAIEALVTPLGDDGPESGTPELTEEDVRTHARRFFLGSIIHDCNISAWHQSERIAVQREGLELKRQQLELKREELALKRKIHERKHEEKRVKSLNSEILESGSAAANIQHSTFNAQHSSQRGKGEKGKGGTRDNIQHPTSNIQHPIEGSPKSRAQSPKSAGANIQHSTFSAQHSSEGEKGKRGKGGRETTSNIQHRTSDIQRRKNRHQRGFLNLNCRVGEEPNNFRSHVLSERARSSWICNETMIE